MNVQDRVNLYATKLQAVLDDAYSFLPAERQPKVVVETGRAYFKLVVVHESQRMAHSFVDRVTGDVFKPAGWAKPAKGARYNVVTSGVALMANVDPYGSYLYANGGR